MMTRRETVWLWRIAAAMFGLAIMYANLQHAH